MENILQELGEKIRVLRQSSGYSQENMADMLQMSPSGYAKIEKGQSDINVSRVQQIAKVFGLTATQLFSIAENKSIVFNTKRVRNSQMGIGQAYNMHNTFEFHGSDEDSDSFKKEVLAALKDIRNRLEKMEK